MQKPSVLSSFFMLATLAAAQWAHGQSMGQQHVAELTGTQGSLASNTSTVTTPALKAPPAGYVLGPSDVIRVSVWKEAELSQTAVVRPDGNISVPLIGEVPVAGKNVIEAEAVIADRLHSVLTNPQVTISVLEIHSRQVYITGEIGHPGAYPLTGSMNVLQLIASAGGLTEYAHKKAIYLLRANARTPVHFNYQNVVRGKTQDQNVQLAPGDTVVVP